jgi:uncharacterized membrane protein
MLDGSAGDAGRHRAAVWPLPADLAAVVALVALVDVVVLVPVLNESPVRVVLGLVFVLVLPGYAVVAALFPETGTVDEPDGTPDASGETAATDAADTADATGTDEPSGTRSIDGIERAALSVALSIPVVALLGLAVSLTPLGVTLATTLPVVSAATLAATAVAARRRSRLPESEQFHVPYRAWLAAGRGTFLEPDSRADFALNVLLAASVLVAVSSVTYAVAAPTEGESYTEFYLLTETETDALVADDYPTEFTVGESRPVVVGVENHEHESVEYTVVAQLQRVRIEGNETTVTETARIDRFTVSLEDNETWQQERSVTPTMAGERLRVAYLLYRGSPPDRPTLENAYREVHLWVTVRADGE